MKRLLMTVAVIEAIVVALSLPVLRMVDPATNSLSILIAVFVLLLIPVVLRRTWGVSLGWLVQGFVLVVSTQNWALFSLALIFAAIWIWAFRLGKQIDNHPRQ